MQIKNYLSAATISLFVLFSLPLAGQQKVDLDKAEAENKNLFTGSFFRLGVGFSRANFNFSTTFDGQIVNPLNFNMEFGKRMNRNFGAYFAITGNVMLQPISIGLYDQMTQWSHTGMYLGGLFYVRGGNSYFAPEIGLGIITFEYDLGGYGYDVYTYGPGATLKYGYDRHIAGRVFVGVQAYISYAYTWDTEASIPTTANSFIYGAALNLKFGK